MKHRTHSPSLTLLAANLAVGAVASARRTVPGGPSRISGLGGSGDHGDGGGLDSGGLCCCLCCCCHSSALPGRVEITHEATD